VHVNERIANVLRLKHITFACDDPRRVAEFWGHVLDYAPEQPGESWAARDPRGEGPELFFNCMRKSPTIELPIHLDVNTLDREREVERLQSFGGTIVETKTSAIGDFSETFTVMRDREGNGFCVQGPDPRKPHSYIGNITFSAAEPRRLGAFWSQALGWPEEEVPEEFLRTLRAAGLDEREFTAHYAARNSEGTRPRLLFQRREKSRPESYPIHLDLVSDDRQEELERLAGTGATVVGTRTRAGQTWTVMRDPEGNPFCIE
jgi:predicted enzyme related to lactoylglutathione lyase